MHEGRKHDEGWTRDGMHWRAVHIDTRSAHGTGWLQRAWGDAHVPGNLSGSSPHLRPSQSIEGSGRAWRRRGARRQGPTSPLASSARIPGADLAAEVVEGKCPAHCEDGSRLAAIQRWAQGRAVGKQATGPSSCREGSSSDPRRSHSNTSRGRRTVQPVAPSPCAWLRNRQHPQCTHCRSGCPSR